MSNRVDSTVLELFRSEERACKCTEGIASLSHHFVVIVSAAVLHVFSLRTVGGKEFEDGD